jgi:two-component system chemotaxis response regulator CheB
VILPGLFADPEDPIVSTMPRRAIERVTVDHVVPISEAGPLLVRLCREQMRGTSIHHFEPMLAPPPTKPPTQVLACPICNGALDETTIASTVQYLCHVGHRFTLDSMLDEESEALESALWTAVRVLEDSEALVRRSAVILGPEAGRRMEERARAYKQHAATIRRILLAGVALDRDGLTRTAKRDLSPAGSQ